MAERRGKPLQVARRRFNANDPEPGYYKTKLVRGGPWVPARIWIEDGQRDPETGELLSDQWIRCEVNGRIEDPFRWWTYLANRPISKEEYDHMDRVRLWAEMHRPDQPEANPNEGVDLDTMPPPSF